MAVARMCPVPVIANLHLLEAVHVPTRARSAVAKESRTDGLRQGRIFRIRRQEDTHTTPGFPSGHRVPKSCRVPVCILVELEFATRRDRAQPAERLTARPTPFQVSRQQSRLATN